MPDTSADKEGRLPGDELIEDAREQITRSIVIEASPEIIWPLVERMTRLDAAHGSSVLRSEPPRVIVLGGLRDHAAARYLPFDAPRPTAFWQATWALVLEPSGARRTVLHARSRVAFTIDAVQWAAVWMHPFNDLIAPDELRHIKEAAEGRPRGTHGAFGLLRDLASTLRHG